MDEISNIRAQVDVLEGRVEAVEAAERGTDDAQFGGEAGAGINQDPKGRKIWECEWSKENNCLMMFCPKGAVTVGMKKLDVDSTAAQREGDELKITTEGIWYLHVYNDRAVLDQKKPGEEESEEPEDQAEEKPNESGEEDGETAILECEIVEISKSKDYIEKQYVVGSVVLVEENATKKKWADPKATIAYGGENDEAPSVSLKIEDEMSSETSEDGGIADEQKPTGKKQLNLDIKLEKPVLALNNLKDAVEIEGGSKISVSVEGQKIKISYDEKKPEEGEKEEGENKDPCDHDSSGDAGGVNPDEESEPGGGGVAGGGSGDGGVPAGGEPHVGDDDCNCE